MQIPKPDMSRIVPGPMDIAAEAAKSVQEGVSSAAGSAADAAAGLLKAKNSAVSKLLNGKAGASLPFPPLPTELHTPLAALSSSIHALSGGLASGMEPTRINDLANAALQNSSSSLLAMNDWMGARGDKGDTGPMQQMQSTSQALMETMQDLRSKASEQMVVDVVLAVATAVVSIVTFGALGNVVAGVSAAAGGTTALVNASAQTARKLADHAGEALNMAARPEAGGVASRKAGLENYMGRYEGYLDAYVSGLAETSGLVDTILDSKEKSTGQVIRMMQAMFETQQKLLDSTGSR